MSKVFNNRFRGIGGKGLDTNVAWAHARTVTDAVMIHLYLQHLVCGNDAS